MRVPKVHQQVHGQTIRAKLSDDMEQEFGTKFWDNLVRISSKSTHKDYINKEF
jgi:hypothetical protein